MLLETASATTIELLENSDLYHILKQESWRKELYRPQYHLHKWWARRLGTSTRLLIIGALTNFNADKIDTLYENHNFAGKVILDPFMGSGTTIGEAIKLGCDTIGNDINPVSHFIVNTTIKSIGMKDFIQVAEESLRKVFKEYESLYTTTDAAGEKRTVDHYFWRMVDACDHCHSENIINSTNLLSRHAYPKKYPRIHTICPKCHSINVGAHGDEYSECISCNHTYENTKGNASKKHFECQHCGKNNSITPRYSKPRYIMVAIRYRNASGGVEFKTPDQYDLDNYKHHSLLRDSIIFNEQIIPDGDTTKQILNFGYQVWTDLFNDRQLIVIDALLKSIDSIDIKYRDLYKLLISTTLENYCKLTSYKGEGTGAVRSGFSRQIYYAEKQYIENNIFGSKDNSGSILSILHHRFKRFFDYTEHPFEISIQKGSETKFSKVEIDPILQPLISNDYAAFEAEKNQRSLVMCGNAADLKIPDSSVDAIITDPPYFDMIDYSELADFFYYWLRQMNITTSKFDSTTSVSVGDIHGNDIVDFSNKMTAAFKEMSRVLKDGHYLIFSFQHKDSKVWKSLKSSLREADFEIVATPLIHAENEIGLSKSKTEPIRFDVIIICQNNKSKKGERIKKFYHNKEAFENLNDSEKIMLDNAIFMLN